MASFKSVEIRACMSGKAWGRPTHKEHKCWTWTARQHPPMACAAAAWGRDRTGAARGPASTGVTAGAVGRVAISASWLCLGQDGEGRKKESLLTRRPCGSESRCVPSPRGTSAGGRGRQPAGPRARLLMLKRVGAHWEAPPSGGQCAGVMNLAAAPMDEKGEPAETHALLAQAQEREGPWRAQHEKYASPVLRHKKKQSCARI